MKISLAIFAICFLLPCARAQQGAAPLREFHFAGGAEFRMTKDSMTDQQVCVAFTPPTNGVTLSFYKVAVFLNLASDVEADYSQAALLRIAEDKPIKLDVPNRPHVIFAPLAQTAAILRALYTQKTIRLRFTEWPSGRIYDEVLQPGDFAAAYDRGVELCGWPKMNVVAVHPAPVVDGPEEKLAAELEEQARVGYVERVESALLGQWAIAKMQTALWGNSSDAALSIARDGKLVDASITKGSGRDDFDRACIAAIRKAAPFAPFPEELRAPQISRNFSCSTPRASR